MDGLPTLNPNPTAGQLSQDVTSLQGFSGIVQQPVSSSPFYNATPAAGSSSLDQFFGKVGSVFGEATHMFDSAASWVGRTLYTTGKDVVQFPSAALHLGQDAYNSWTYSSAQDGITQRMQDASAKWRSGQISTPEFKSELASINSDNQNLSGKISGLTTKLQSDSNAFKQDSIALMTTVITVATGGLTGLGAAGDVGAKELGAFLTTRAATDFMAAGEQSIQSLALNKALFDLLPSGIQAGVRGAVTDTFLKVGADMTSSQIARATAINLAIKYPIAFNYLTGTQNQLIDEMQSGKYGNAIKTLGFNMALLFSGGPIGQALKYSGKGLSAFSGKMFGSTSFIDELSKAAGYQVNDIYGAIKDNPDLIKSFQALEATNLAAEDGRTIDAAYRVVNGLKINAPDIFGSDPKAFVQDVHNWYIDQKAVTDRMTSLVGAAEARKFVVGRWSAGTKNWVAGELTRPGLPMAEDLRNTGVSGKTVGEYNSQQVLDNFNRLKIDNPNSAFANNSNLTKQIENIIGTSSSYEELHSGISTIKASAEQTVPKDLAKALEANGHIVIAPAKLKAPFIEGTQKLVSGAATNSEFFQKAVQPAPVLREVGNLLTNIGLSPVRAQESVSRLYNEALVKNLEKTSINMDPVLMRSKLSETMNQINASRFQLNHPPLMDLRQLTVKEIGQSLGINSSQAKEVAGALMDSMIEVPAAVKGLGNKLVDNVMKVNAGGKLSMGGYLRAQGAGRFAWNPFFKMKASYKYESLTQLESGGKFPTVLGTNKIMSIVFPGRYAEIRNTVKVLDERGMLGSGFVAEAANETAAGYGLTAARLTESQKLTVGSFVMSMANKAGMGTEDFINNFPNEVKDATESLLHYNPKASFLNSPLARTLNFAFFPFRFNVKVASYMARVLQRQDVLTQVAVVHGMMQAHQFLTSTEGQVWYSQNSDVLGLLEYFTPVAELKVVAALGDIKDQSVGSFGELGGLPVGFVTQILQSEGLWNPSTPYLNPKTGIPSSEYIPATDKAKLATALSTFIGSMFTYPGATAGLPAKAKALSSLTQGLTGSKAADWNVVPETNLTPQQQQFQKAVQSLNPPPTAAQPTQSGASGLVPRTENGTASPIYTPAELKSKSKLKKSQEPIQLLPGQTKLGQP